MRMLLEQVIGGLIFTLFIIKMPFGIERLDARAEQRGTSRGFEAAKLLVATTAIMWLPVLMIDVFTDLLCKCLRSL